MTLIQPCAAVRSSTDIELGQLLRKKFINLVYIFLCKVEALQAPKKFLQVSRFFALRNHFCEEVLQKFHRNLSPRVTGPSSPVPCAIPRLIAARSSAEHPFAAPSNPQRVTTRIKSRLGAGNAIVI